MNNTDRQVSTVKRMNDERFIANVYDSGYSIARMKRSRGTRYVFHGPMIVTMFNFLGKMVKIKFTLKHNMTSFHRGPRDVLLVISYQRFNRSLA